MGARTWTDEQLRKAVADARSWRSTCFALGLQSASSASIRGLQRHAARLGLDTSHFPQRPSWTDGDLKLAVSSSSTWGAVAAALGLIGGGKTITSLKGRAHRLGLDTQHLSAPRLVQLDAIHQTAPDLINLRLAAMPIAMTWFLLRGGKPSLPVEPCPYDLIVDIGGGLQRIQVKTVTHRSPDGWDAPVARSGRPDRHYRVYYDPGEIDFFFIVDGDLGLYLIPLAVVAGKLVISLKAYAAYRVGTARCFLEDGVWPS